MLKFNETNIFSIDNTKNIKFVQPQVPNSLLIPFQFHSEFKGVVNKIYLINAANTIDITSQTAIYLICYQSDNVNAGFWYIFENINELDIRVCGDYQLKIILTNNVITKTFYSNYFTLINTVPDSYLTFTSTKQFLGNTNRYYSDTYFEKIYFSEFYLRKLEPIKFSKPIDNGNGTESFAYQRNTKKFELKLLCNNVYLDILENINLYDIIVLNSTNYQININTAPEISFDFDDGKGLYDVTITFVGDYIEIKNCNTVIPFNRYTSIINDVYYDDEELKKAVFGTVAGTEYLKTF